MRIVRVLALVTLVIGLSACACRTKKAGTGDEANVTDGQGGGPLKDVNFAFDSYALDAAAKNVLSGNATWLKQNSAAKAQVEGHCDERGTNEYNMVLGANRARAAADYLRSLGVEQSRLSTVSYGEEVPVDPRHTEEAWAKNRRAHFNVQ